MITLINHQGLKIVSGIQLQSPSPSIGLAYVGGYLKYKGLSYTGIDACGEALDQVRPYRDTKEIMVQGLTIPQVIKRIPHDTKIFGFTCLFSHCWPLVNEMATQIRKRYPRAHFVAGGEHPTALPEPILKAGIFDSVVLGEGEETLYELVCKILGGEDWQTINGLIYRDKNTNTITRNAPRKRITDIDRFPYPDWDSWPIEQYIDHSQVTGINFGRAIPILGSRGCPYACTFCSNEDMWTRRYIMRGAKALVDEMEYLKEKYRVESFTFMDSTFIVNRRKTLEFARELIERDLKITYQLPAGTRCEAFDEELAMALDQSGLKNFALAPESGSEMILTAIKKQIDIGRLIEATKVILRTSMTVGIFIVIGFPEETKRSLNETLKLIRKLALMGAHDVTVSKFIPYPGSPYYNQFLQQGRVMPDYQQDSGIINFYSEADQSYCDRFTPKQLQRYMYWFFLNFYILSFIARPWRVIRNLKDYLVRGVENTRYMRLVAELFAVRPKWKLKGE
jgi:anaerobic magnesium-protoporphyrin IX monomethyl ester cyclase